MNKKEIAEIKKQYSIKKCAIQRLAVGYIDGEKNVKSVWSGSFLNLPEEEIYKYLEIVKKGLSGTIGKNIRTLEYSTEQEASGSMHDFLLKLRETKLTNENMVRVFCEKVAESYPEVQNVAVVLIYNVYDIPCKGKDNLKNMEASDEVYEYIACHFCPVELEAPGLVFSAQDGKFVHKECRWQLAMPVHGFTFPSFEDRTEDIHNITVYSKKADGSFDEFDKDILGIEPGISADTQRESFAEALSEAVLECENPISVISTIQESILANIEESEESNPELSYDRLCDIVKDAGVPEKASENLIEVVKESMDNKTLMATNLVDKKTTKIKSSDVEIKVDVEHSSSIERREIDGTTYLLVPLTDTSDIEINGVKVS